jgi:hypothetical protein
MLTMMDEEVLELCTMTVTSTPITRPATGLDMMELLLKNCPATFPERQTNSHVIRGSGGGTDCSPSRASWLGGRALQPCWTYGILLPCALSLHCPISLIGGGPYTGSTSFPSH